MKINRFAHYRALSISALLAAVLWCFACSFYSTAISHCTSVGIKWEKERCQPLRAYQAADVCKAGWSRKPAGGHLMADIPGTGDNGFR